jgi:chaperone modulatory protein CbpM
MKNYKLEEIENLFGLAEELINEFIENEWLKPCDPEAHLCDDQDVARARLIIQLRDDFGVNDEAVPIILHLVDQLVSNVQK